jgi:dCTP deaminase
MLDFSATIRALSNLLPSELMPMSVLPDFWIREMALKHKMIEPFARARSRKGRISYGASSYGYDFRLAREFKVPQIENVPRIDPKRMERVPFREVLASSCLIPPNSYILGRSLEYFRIPRDVLVICQGKSTYARCGIVVNVTPLEPEWEGFITISIANVGAGEVKIYSGEGIGQAVFLRAEHACEISYADRKGKYQAPKGIQISRV